MMLAAPQRPAHVVGSKCDHADLCSLGLELTAQFFRVWLRLRALLPTP